ncbi:hypothetical protein BC830DRAFT_1099217 [Chytriomyces sp. MP71]|nr:hypothetical protein BC830DRAFT_1099217 [Chytriomyces sp. MP71]
MRQEFQLQLGNHAFLHSDNGEIRTEPQFRCSLHSLCLDFVLRCTLIVTEEMASAFEWLHIINEYMAASQIVARFTFWARVRFFKSCNSLMISLCLASNSSLGRVESKFALGNTVLFGKHRVGFLVTNSGSGFILPILCANTAWLALEYSLFFFWNETFFKAIGSMASC